MLEHWKSLDVSPLTDDWVKHTDDFLFRTLNPNERYLLQLVFAKELSWTEIATILDVNAETVRNRFKEIMLFLENRAKAKPTVREMPSV
jgi:DNA-directed RNA polymerase specialized sigma subunit